MVKPHISFSHLYAKLGYKGFREGHYEFPFQGNPLVLVLSFEDYDGHEATLKHVSKKNFMELDREFLAYDTMYYEDGRRQEAPKTFKTVRTAMGRYVGKTEYYVRNIGQRFTIILPEPTSPPSQTQI